MPCAFQTGISIDLAATGRNIKRLRLEAGLTVRDLQGKLGFASPQAIYKWQSRLTAPTVDNLVILADAFGVEVDEIIVRSNLEL